MLVGENNAGKSNVIDALRTVLEPEAGPRARHWLTQDDFAHDGHGNRLSDELKLEVRLGGLSTVEQARMVTCLSPKDGPGTAKIRVKAKVGPGGRISTQWFGGDAEQPDIEQHARDAVRFVCLHPLRDAAADLRPGRDNRLVPLLKALAPEDHADHQKIIDAAQMASTALESIDVIADARKHVSDRLSRARHSWPKSKT